MSDLIPHDAQHLLKFGAEVGLASYAFDNAVKRQRPESIPGQVANLAGGFVILHVLFHFIVLPYLAITGVICGSPFFIAMVASHNWVVGLPILAIGFFVWVRYAIYKVLWRGFLRPVEGFLAAKPAVAIKEPVINGTATRVYAGRTYLPGDVSYLIDRSTPS